MSTNNLEKYYRIIGNGKLQMKEDTPVKSEQFRTNLRQLMKAKMASRQNQGPQDPSGGGHEPNQAPRQ